MELTKEELKIIKDRLSESLESAYKSVEASNAKELAFAPLKHFNGEIDVENTQSALKKVIERIVDDN